MGDTYERFIMDMYDAGFELVRGRRQRQLVQLGKAASL